MPPSIWSCAAESHVRQARKNGAAFLCFEDENTFLFCSQDLSTAISMSQSFLKDEHLYDHQLDNRLACSSASLCTRRPDPRNSRGSRQQDFAAAMSFSMKGLMKRHQLKSQYAGTGQSEDLVVDLLAPIACRLVPRTVFTDLARQS